MLRQRARTVRLIAAAVLALVVLLPSVAAAQDSEPGPGTGTETPGTPDPKDGDSGEGPARVSCEEASDDFLLLCYAYEFITTRHVDSVGAEVLAAAAERGVREAGLAPRTGDAAESCALPAPEFEQTCAAIDAVAVADVAAAVWAATAAMLSALGDPHTGLLTAKQYEAFEKRLEQGEPFVGIGVKLGLLSGLTPCSVLSATCRLVISEVMPDSPAERAGLRADDIIVELDGLVPVGAGCGLNDLRTFESGTRVAVKVERDGRVQDFQIDAAAINLPVAAGRIVDGDIGYLRLDSFSRFSDEALSREFGALLESGAESVVLDLRGNPGGYLRAVVDIASLFLADQAVVTQEVSREEVLLHRAEKHRGSSDPTVLPMVVAVDGLSASASELLTLALRDHGRATIVGSVTYGKNTGQLTRTVESADGSVLGAVRLTVLRWLSPEGISAAGGIEPDVAVTFATCGHPVGMARQAVAAARLPGAELADIGQAGERFDAVQTLLDDGVLEGTECQRGMFCPDDPVSRAALAVWLVRVLDGADPEPGNTSTFEDVDPSSWWAPHVERLAELGVTEGCRRAPAWFCPLQPVSRAQAATMLRTAFGFKAAVPAGFVDISDNAVAADASALFAVGVTAGCSASPLRFCPHQATSRGAMAVLLERARSY